MLLLLMPPKRRTFLLFGSPFRKPLLLLLNGILPLNDRCSLSLNVFQRVLAVEVMDGIRSPIMVSLWEASNYPPSLLILSFRFQESNAVSLSALTRTTNANQCLGLKPRKIRPQCNNTSQTPNTRPKPLALVLHLKREKRTTLVWLELPSKLVKKVLFENVGSFGVLLLT